MAATFVVNNRFDTGTGGCNATECTLREAIVAANATTAADTINFSFRAINPPEVLIQPATPLPTITQPVTINGYSVAGSSVNTDAVASNAVLRIRVDGLNAGASASGFAICADSVTLRGLSITRFQTDGIAFGRDAAGALCANTSSGGAMLGNFIGLTSNGATAAGNAGGVSSSQAQVVVGSSAAADRNVIGSNAGHAVQLINAGSSNSSVLGNLIGTDKSGALDRGNNSSGVDLGPFAASVTVGSAVAPNKIAFNFRGVVVRSTLNNRLFANHYGPNDGLGIELLDAALAGGVSPNDSGDGDGGGNGQQNYLDDGFTADRTPTGISIQGTLRRSTIAAPITFTIAAYATPACDPSGHGEGEQFLGTATESTISGIAPINVDIPLATQPPAGSFITTTVTSPGGSTSEFSTCAPLDPPPLVVNSTNDVADGACNATHCSLRDAIIAANADADASVINFNIALPATGELMIQPTAVLPTLTAPVLIDGYSQAGTSVNTDPLVSNAVLRIRISGDAFNTVNASGLAVCGDDSVIRGLSITGFDFSSNKAINIGADASGTTCSDVTGTRVIGNFLGLASDGSTSARNGTGVTLNISSADIGGESIADRNVIAEADFGVFFFLSLDGTRILNNIFGTDRTGLNARALGIGVRMNAAQNVEIGTASAPNRFRFVLGDSISTFSNANNSDIVAIYNSISASGDLAFDLAGDGVTLNDIGSDDADTGPNGLQNFPVITKAERSAAGIVISGTLDVKVGTSNVPYTIGVYANTTCDAPSGHGEGERLLGAATVNLTQATGETFSFELTTDDPLEAGVQITATATGPEGSSEFSACVAATDAPPGIAVNSTADPGAGTCNGADECTLRQAITLANTQVGADLIRFEIPGDGPHEIQLASLLPFIAEALTIDGYTQLGASENAAEPDAGSDAVLKIVVDGQGARANLLRTCTTGAVVLRGLALGGASDAAVATRSNDSACSAAGALVMTGNFVGLRPDGTTFSNGLGILVNNTVATIGGSARPDRNIISNGSFGLIIQFPGSSGSTVQNNLIGTGVDPNIDFGNATLGVLVSQASNVTLGGEGGVANVLAFNGGGVLLQGGDTGNRVYANEFVANDNLGIDLGASNFVDGVTPNDINDVDTGANNLQNFPELLSGSATASSITINGTLDVPDTVVAPLAYTLAFYESAACDGSGNGEGEIYLGSRQVNFTDSAQAFSETLAIPPSAGASVITATATDPDGNTSEFSNCLAGPQVPLPVQIFANGFEG